MGVERTGRTARNGGRGRGQSRRGFLSVTQVLAPLPLAVVLCVVKLEARREVNPNWIRKLVPAAFWEMTARLFAAERSCAPPEVSGTSTWSAISSFPSELTRVPLL